MNYFSGGKDLLGLNGKIVIIKNLRSLVCFLKSLKHIWISKILKVRKKIIYGRMKALKETINRYSAIWQVHVERRVIVLGTSDNSSHHTTWLVDSRQSEKGINNRDKNWTLKSQKSFDSNLGRYIMCWRSRDELSSMERTSPIYLFFQKISIYIVGCRQGDTISL